MVVQQWPGMQRMRSPTLRVLFAAKIVVCSSLKESSAWGKSGKIGGFPLGEKTYFDGVDINPDDILFVLALYDIAKGTLELAKTDFDVYGNKLSLSIDLTEMDLDNKELKCFLWEKETLAPMVPKGQPLR